MRLDHPGTSGGAFDLALASGTFAVQTTWANDGAAGAGACEASHPIVTNGAGSGTNTATVTAPASQSTKRNTAVSLQISAADSASGQTLSYRATGLPGVPGAHPVAPGIALGAGGILA